MSKLIVVADKGDTVNLRKLPSRSSSILTQIKLNKQVELLEKESDEWYKVQYGSYTGYIMSKYLKDAEKSELSKADLQAVYNSLKETLTLIEKILK